MPGFGTARSSAIPSSASTPGCWRWRPRTSVTPAIRNRGTLGGSLAHADPAAELPAALLALDGTVVVARRVQAGATSRATDLFEGFFVTALAPTTT